MPRVVTFSHWVSKPHGVLILSATSLLTLAMVFYLSQRWGTFTGLRIKEEAPKIGVLAPDFELRDVDGRTVRLSQFRGKSPIFLNFWASWCPACREEAPENEKLHQRLGPKGLKFLSVSIDAGSTAVNDVRKFMKEFGLSFSPLLDSDGQVYHFYGVTGIPTTFLIDRNGKIVAKEVGPKRWSEGERLKRLEELVQ